MLMPRVGLGDVAGWARARVPVRKNRPRCLEHIVWRSSLALLGTKGASSGKKACVRKEVGREGRRGVFAECLCVDEAREMRRVSRLPHLCCHLFVVTGLEPGSGLGTSTA